MKTIKVGNQQLELTEERTSRIVDAMSETQSKLDKELAYSEDLQNKDEIERYRNHIAYLEDMLS